MFGFLKKKGNPDNGTGYTPEKTQSSRQPAGPWAQAESLMDQGQAAEAMRLFARTCLQTRDLSHLDTAERWLSSQALLDKAGEEAVCYFAALLTQVLDHVEPVQRQRLWDGCLKALRALGDNTAVRQDMTDRYVAECILLRHMGRPGEGLKAAQEGISRHRTAYCHTFAGLCCLDMDDTRRAEDYIRQGLELDPKYLAPCNDLGDYFFNHRMLDKAIEYYSLAVERGDLQDIEWAEPSLIFCRWQKSGNPEELERLALLAACQPRNQRAAELRGAVSRTSH